MSTAVPATTSPKVKIPMPPNSGIRGPRASQISPATTVANSEATRKPENAHPYAPKPCSSRTATGIAVATAIASKAPR